MRDQPDMAFEVTQAIGQRLHPDAAPGGEPGL